MKKTGPWDFKRSITYLTDPGPSAFVSVQPLRPRCLSGESYGPITHHRDTEDAEVAQRKASGANRRRQDFWARRSVSPKGGATDAKDQVNDVPA